MESAFPYLLWYGFRDSSGWRIDLVDPVWQDEGDFAFSWPLISADWWCIPRISYYPYYDASGYREKYAELTPFKPTNTLWHAIRKGPDNWEEQEYITARIGPCSRFLADKKGYLISCLRHQAPMISGMPRPGRMWEFLNPCPNRNPAWF